MNHPRSTLLLLLLHSFFFFFFFFKAQFLTTSAQPLGCHDSNRVCSAYLYYNLSSNQSRADVASLFTVDLSDITPDPARKTNTQDSSQGLFIRVNCSCLIPSFSYFANSSYFAAHEMSSSDIVSGPYENLAWAQEYNNTSMNSTNGIVPKGANVPISLLCGCLDNTRDFGFLLSYVVKPNDTLSGLVTRFGSSISSIVTLNNISNENVLNENRVYYLPINISQLTEPASVPVSLAPTVSLTADSASSSSNGFPLKMVLGIVGGTCILVLIAIGVILLARKYVVTRHAKLASDIKSIPSRNDAQPWSLCGSNNLNVLELCLNGSSTVNKSSKGPTTVSREIMNVSMSAEKPVVYAYEEIQNATENFKESNILGQGAFGMVYYGVLRDQEVAIKRMKAIITKEFLAEIKVLCKFHHTNLNELYGYSSYGDDLFLVYEYAEHRALADRLHEPMSKGLTPLTWSMRVQIALDTAKGLEYIHEHTKEHYVHRDVKTSNILLDTDFRAKVADFGLAKLVEKTDGGDASVTRIVGTFGYLAPEYSRDGIATSKSDVYAFGVVLFELITGKEAISKSRVSIPSTPERRSLISIVSRALRECPNSIEMGRLREIVDPILNDLFPPDCLYKMAKLGQACVEEDPILRPDMRYVVFTLSQILLSSIQWEATLGGSSQIFSGLVQGR